jgi:hypothetical protein
MFLSESFYGTSAWWKSLNGVCTLIIFHYVRAQWNNVTCLHILILRGRKLPPLLYTQYLWCFDWKSMNYCQSLKYLFIKYLCKIGNFETWIEWMHLMIYHTEDFCRSSIVLIITLWKESLKSDGQQFPQYEQNEQLPLTSNKWGNFKNYHDVWCWKSIPCLT